MALLSIPKPVIIGLDRIATLSDESYLELLAALERIPLKIRQHKVFDDTELNLQTISPADIRSIRDALFPLYIASASGKTPVSKYVDDVVESLKDERQGGTDWTQSEEAVSQFKERLLQLLSVSSLHLIAKAHDVLLEHAHTFSGARILSDIRPVFGENVEEPPTAAVIVHMLNLVYYRNGEREEFVVALDTTDIQLLLDALERAKKKTDSLKSTIESTGLTYLEVV
jgi:hypothetical protein